MPRIPEADIRFASRGDPKAVRIARQDFGDPMTRFLRHTRHFVRYAFCTHRLREGISSRLSAGPNGLASD